jgi:hypothetical protein
MGKRGPPRKPTMLKELAGTMHTRDRRRGPEPLAPGELGDPPASFSEAQQAKWYEALAAAPPGLLRKIDGQVLAAFVLAGELVEQANIHQEEMNKVSGKLPLLVRGSHNAVALSPYVKLKLRAIPLLLRAAAECGFSPASRTALVAGVAPAEGDDADAARWRLWDEVTEKIEDNPARLLAMQPASARE